MIVRALCCLLILFCFGEARVDFNRSQVYDEFDFQGKSTVLIEKLCANTCAIYASITPESKKYAANLLIQLPKGFLSVADLASQFDPATNQKSPLVVKNTATLSIVNSNPQKEAGPLVLYVINNFYLEAPGAEVYEAEGFLRPVSSFPDSVTVMSARPFTLKQARLEGEYARAPQGVTAKMRGFDDKDERICVGLYNVKLAPHYPGFTIEVNGPIVTVWWERLDSPIVPGELTATIGISNTQQLEISGWVGSPGFQGCQRYDWRGYLKPYRSSLYDVTTPFHSEITNERLAYMDAYAFTNSDAAHELTISDPATGGVKSLNNTDDEVYLNFYTKNLSINWTPDGSIDTYFYFRYNSSMH